VKLVAGLGNPGPRYADSRHNVGFRVVVDLARRCGVALDRERFHGRYGSGHVPVEPESVSPAEAPAAAAGEPLGLLQPLTYMNDSGRALAAAVSELCELDPERDLIVVYDDADLPLGRIRLRPSGGDGGHGGMESVIEALGTRNLPRLRFGIGRPEAGGELRDVVLDGFTPEEELRLDRDIPRASLAVLTVLQSGFRAAMNRFNSDPRDPERAPDPDPPAR
jgi:PTH1 family peptidyl-tRNA hydrolase